MAKPMIKLGEIEQWRKDISALAVYENVYCKVSDMVTEANYQQVNDIPQKYINNLSLNEQEKFWGANAVNCYQIRQ